MRVFIANRILSRSPILSNLTFVTILFGLKFMFVLRALIDASFQVRLKEIENLENRQPYRHMLFDTVLVSLDCPPLSLSKISGTIETIN